MASMIRLARSEDLPRLREVERAAGVPFRSQGMDAVADAEVPSVAELAFFQENDRAWVATDVDDEPVGYLLVDIVDGAGHIEQVSVLPSHARQGLGASLIKVAVEWAKRQGLAAVTLTTFAEVPWNAPYYQRLGFHIVAETDIGEGLQRVRDHEAALGLDVWPRVSMRRSLVTGPSQEGLLGNRGGGS